MSVLVDLAGVSGTIDWSSAMIVIGILGGVACGKSLVAEQLKQLGAEVLDADRQAHEVLRETPVKTALRNRWGSKVFDPSGEVNRGAIAAIVFADDEKGAQELKFLEELVHPRIGRRLEQRMQQLRVTGQTRVAVLDAAVMLKAGWNRICDKIVFVDAPRPLRLARALQRGWSQEHFEAREKAQESLEEKRSYARAVIDNSGDPAATFAQVQELWRTLQAE